MSVREFLKRLRFLFDRGRRMDELESEMRLHRELRAAKLGREGLTEAEAIYDAERRFGNKTLLKERSVDMWGWMWLEDLFKDVRYTYRSLCENPLFAVVAILMLALGIGANTAIFSVTNAVVLRALPAHDPHQLFYLQVLPGQPDGAGNTGDSQTSFSEYVFEQLRTQHQAFANVLAYVPVGLDKVAVRAGKEPEEAAVDMVSGDFFSGLGVGAVCGRTLTPADEQEHAGVAVLQYGFWSRRFAKSCSALGQTLYVKGVPFTIVGVTNRSFLGVEGRPTEVWIPLQKRPELNAWGMQEDNYYAAPNWWCLMLIARLAPDVTARQAEAMATPAFLRAAHEHLGGKPHKGEAPPKLALAPARGAGPTQQGLEKPLYILLAMVGVILVIACGNVGMLLTARNAARRREFSIRLAIGGSQARLFRQLLAESLVLVALGAALGWGFAIVATRALAAWAQLEISFAPDLRVLVFTLVISAAAALAFGLAPLFSLARVPVGLALKNSSATAFQERSKSKLGQGIVALQVSLCLILTISAGLLMQTLRNLEHENLGFKTNGLLVFGLNPQLKSSSETQVIRFYGDLLDKLRTLPGVESVTLMQNRLGTGWSNNTNAFVGGRDARATSADHSDMMRWNAVGPDYFRTLGVPIRLGRDFADSDSASAPKVAIVNETFAQKFLKGREPLGHQASFSSRVPYTVVGVAANSKYTGVREDDIPMAYFPFTQVSGAGAMHVELRTAGDPAGFLPEVRTAVASLAPDLALLQPMTQQAQFEISITEERLVARLSMFFGGLAVLLIATGIYGTLAYTVSRRTSELGIRMAVGAQRGELLWMILRESFAICAIGIVIGLPLALASTRVLASLLYGLAARDPLTICIAALGIILVSLAASLLPARRAASVDPIVALRYE
ncbi:MAG: ABC transporter permease [Bryobacteraceae bacterium]